MKNVIIRGVLVIALAVVASLALVLIFYDRSLPSYYPVILYISITVISCALGIFFTAQKFFKEKTKKTRVVSVFIAAVISGLCIATLLFIVGHQTITIPFIHEGLSGR